MAEVLGTRMIFSEVRSSDVHRTRQLSGFSEVLLACAPNAPVGGGTPFNRKRFLFYHSLFCVNLQLFWPHTYKNVMLNLAEHVIFPAHKC